MSLKYFCCWFSFFKRVVLLAGILTAILNNTVVAQKRSLTLNEAINVAIQHNSLLQQDKYLIDAAGQRSRLQQSNYYPTIQFRSNVSHANEAPRIPVEFKNDTVLARQGTQNTFIARFEMSQLVYDFGKTKHSVAAARYGTSVQKAYYSQDLANIAVRVKQQFYTSLAYEKLDSIYTSLIPFNERLAKINEDRLKNGVILSPDALRAQVDLQKLLSQRAVAQNELFKGLNQLSLLMGIQTREFVPEGTLPSIPDTKKLMIAYEKLYSQALQNRHDIKALNFQENQQHELSKAYASEHLPTIMLQGDFSYFGPDAFGYYSNLSSRGLKNYNWRIGIGFSYPIFSGMKTRYRKNEAIALEQNFHEQSSWLKKQIGTQIRDILSNLGQLRQLLISNEAVLKQAKVNLKIVTQAYKNGAISELEYIESLIPAAYAEASVVETKQKIALALTELEHAVGQPVNLNN